MAQRCDKVVVSAAGSDSNDSGSGQLAVMAPTTSSEASLREAAPNSPPGSSPKPKPASQKLATSPKASLSPKSGSKRKAADI